MTKVKYKSRKLYDIWLKKKIGIIDDCKVKYKNRKLHLIKKKIGIIDDCKVWNTWKHSMLLYI